MQRTIWLDPQHPKCITSTTKCSRADSCAAHEIPYSQGRPVADCSAAFYWSAQGCGSFVSMADAHEPAEPRKTHPPIGSQA